MDKRTDRDFDTEGDGPLNTAQLAHQLEELALLESSVLEEASRLDDAPGLDRVDAILQEEWRSTPRESSSRVADRSSWLRPALALAATVTLVFGFWGELFGSNPKGTPFPIEGQTLGFGDFEKVSPLGEDASFDDLLQWNGPEGAIFSLSFFGLPEGLEVAPLTVEAHQFDLGSLDVTGWPEEVWILVTELGDSPGNTGASLSWKVGRLEE